MDRPRWSTLATPTDLRPQPGTFLTGPDGAWLAWDADKDRGAYRIAWSTSAGMRDYTLTKGRSFTSAALESSRGLVAMSATTMLSIGSAQDVLAIKRTSDGQDIFRRYLPRCSRSPTVFFSGGLFGYSELDGVHVVRMGK